MKRARIVVAILSLRHNVSTRVGASFVNIPTSASSKVNPIIIAPFSNPVTTTTSFFSSNYNGVDDDSTTSTCPFSKSFPKYRIDLSSKSKEEKAALERKKSILPSSLSTILKMPASVFSDFQKGMDENKFQRQYPNELTEWRDNQDGIYAFASLWKSADTLLSFSGESETSIVLAYPDCRTSVLQRWIDIFQWMQQQQQSNENIPTIEAKVLENGHTIRLSRKKEYHDNDDDGDAPVFSTKSQEDATIDPAVIEKRMQAWVKRVLVEMKICPFTKSVSKSGQGLADLGVPVGKIAYHASAASPQQICHLMADTWMAIANMIEAGPSGKEGISSILMAAPKFDEDFDLWSGPIFAMLEAGVVAAGAEGAVGVVCFHPKYATPDGTSFPGFGHMHSVPRLQQWVTENAPSQDLSIEEVAAGGAWQRRTPHATINVLRADQLEAAEGRRQSGIMYSENICRLVGNPDGLGNEKLAEDLQKERKIS